MTRRWCAYGPQALDICPGGVCFVGSYLNGTGESYERWRIYVALAPVEDWDGFLRMAREQARSDEECRRRCAEQVLLEVSS